MRFYLRHIVRDLPRRSNHCRPALTPLRFVGNPYNLFALPFIKFSITASFIEFRFPSISILCPRAIDTTSFNVTISKVLPSSLEHLYHKPPPVSLFACFLHTSLTTSASEPNRHRRRMIHGSSSRCRKSYCVNLAQQRTPKPKKTSQD